MKIDRTAHMALLAALAAVPAASAEGFRCGQRIATPDMTVEELLGACGQPTTRTVEVVDVHGPGVRGSGNVKRGTVTVETWTYVRSPQGFDMVVTIEDGNIKKMERAE